MSQSAPNALLERAFFAVRAACRVTRQAERDLDGIRKIIKDDRSPVSVADFAAQAIVARQLKETALPLVGEEDALALRAPANRAVLDAVLQALQCIWEQVSADSLLDAVDLGNHDATAASYWTLDPIDGTKGFLRGQHYAVSLALIRDGEVAIAALGCPNMSLDPNQALDRNDRHGVILLAVRGQGASQGPADGGFADQRAIVRPSLSPDARIRVCESVESGHSRQDLTSRIVAELGGAGEPARIDSQCKYGVVARGQADAYLRLPTRADYVEKIWDHAAGMLVAEEAGCRVTDIDGKGLDFSRGTTLAGNRGIVCADRLFHAGLITAIAKLPEFQF